MQLKTCRQFRVLNPKKILPEKNLKKMPEFQLFDANFSAVPFIWI